MSEDRQRLDRWLWIARFFKSRSLAARFCTTRGLRVNGARVAKAHHGLRIGDVITVAVGPRVRIVRVIAFAERRGPAAEARRLYEDLAPAAAPPALAGAGSDTEAGGNGSPHRASG